jgi:hypothetical protein
MCQSLRNGTGSEPLTDLLREHVPLELGQVLHRPHVVAPARALLPADRLCVQHARDCARDLFIPELNPALGEVRLLRRRELLAQVRALRICVAV